MGFIITAYRSKQKVGTKLISGSATFAEQQAAGRAFAARKGADSFITAPAKASR